MNARERAKRWLKDAQEDCEDARKHLQNNARVWTHDPSSQVRSLIPTIAKTAQEHIDLATLADTAALAAPWHVWTTDGKAEETAREVAQSREVDDIVVRATRAVEIAGFFVRGAETA